MHLFIYIQEFNWYRTSIVGQLPDLFAKDIWVEVVVVGRFKIVFDQRVCEQLFLPSLALLLVRKPYTSYRPIFHSLFNVETNCIAVTSAISNLTWTRYTWLTRQISDLINTSGSASKYTWLILRILVLILILNRHLVL